MGHQFCCFVSKVLGARLPYQVKLRCKSLGEDVPVLGGRAGARWPPGARCEAGALPGGTERLRTPRQPRTAAVRSAACPRRGRRPRPIARQPPAQARPTSGASPRRNPRAPCSSPRSPAPTVTGQKGPLHISFSSREPECQGCLSHNTPCNFQLVQAIDVQVVLVDVQFR